MITSIVENADEFCLSILKKVNLVKESTEFLKLNSYEKKIIKELSEKEAYMLCEVCKKVFFYKAARWVTI